jgi:hypothetical protein
VTTVGSDCRTGKRQFADKRSADENVRYNRAAHGWTELRAYKCRICKCWHTGNQLPKAPRGKRRRK